MTPHAATMAYLDTLPLVDALFWFIENVSDDTPGRTDIFFALRERYREHSRGEPAETTATLRAMNQPLAYLKLWGTDGTSRVRVDLHAACEAWLADAMPTVIPLYATPPAGG